MNHTVSGHNFHGFYSVTVRAPKEGGPLSQRQLNKIYNALCGMSDCVCGGMYGEGQDEDSATIDQYGVLYPALKERR